MPEERAWAEFSISGKALKTFDEKIDAKRWVINLAMVFRMHKQGAGGKENI